MKTDELVTVVEGFEPKGFKIPAPPDQPDYRKEAAGFCGDYRPLSVRQSEREEQ